MTPDLLKVLMHMHKWTYMQTCVGPDKDPVLALPSKSTSPMVCSRALR